MKYGEKEGGKFREIGSKIFVFIGILVKINKIIGIGIEFYINLWY